MRPLHPRLIEVLDAIVRVGSMRKAASRLHVSPSSLSRQVLALEAELGLSIFQRLPRKLRLTGAGEIIIEHVRQALRETERLEGRLEDLKGLRRGEVCVATMAGLASNFLTQQAIEFRKRHSRVNLIFERSSLDDMVADVAAGNVDLGFAFDVRRQANIRMLAAVECRLGAVVRPDHPLASKASVRLADCAAFPLIFPGRTMVFRGLLDEAFAKGSLTAEPVVETTEFEMMKRFAAETHGVAFLNRINMDVERRRGELVFIPIRDPNLASQSLCLFHSDRSGLSVIASRFAEAVRTALEEIGSANL